MALPTITKTWEFHTNAAIDVANYSTNLEEGARALQIWLLNFMTGKKKKAYGGTFADQGGGTVRFTATARGGNPFITGSDKFDSTDVGENAVFVGCSSAANDGSFAITAVDTSAGTWVEFTNGSAVFGADTTCCMHVDDGYFTSPLTVKGSSASAVTRGAAMDGRDRWLLPTDINANTTGNRDWVVVKTTNGAEMLLWNDTDSTSYQFCHAVIQYSAENGFTGGSYTTSPTATDAATHSARSAYWTPADNVGSDPQWFISQMITSDGKNWRLFFHGDPNSNAEPIGLASLFFAMEQAANPITSGALIPWNGNNNICMFSRSALSYANTYAAMNDATKVTSTIDKDGTAGGPYVAWYYLSTEMIETAMLGQQQVPYKNSLQEGWEIYPISLFSLTTGVKGRHGTVADMWWGQDTVAVPPRHGATFPSSGTGTHLQLSHMVVPWDGSILRITQK